MSDVPAFGSQQLVGFRIGVTSDRRSEDLIDAFERRGATVMHGPTLRIAHAHLDNPIIDDTKAISAETSSAPTSAPEWAPAVRQLDPARVERSA